MASLPKPGRITKGMDSIFGEAFVRDGDDDDDEGDWNHRETTLSCIIARVKSISSSIFNELIVEE